MPINNLQLLGDHFIQTGQLLKQWNLGERMTGGTVQTVGGGTGGAGGARGPRTSRSRTRARGQQTRTGLGAGVTR